MKVMLSLSMPKMSNLHRYQYILLVAVLIALTVCTDLMHSVIKNYSFYISESLLFSTYWMLFVPLILLLRKCINMFDPYSTLLCSLIFSFTHLVCFSLLIHLGSWMFLYQTYDLSRTFLLSITEDGLSCVFIYGMAALVWRRYRLNNTSPQFLHKKLKVKEGNRTILIDHEEIIYVKTEKPYIAIITKDKRHLIKGSLTKFLDKNADKDFIQIHKSTIVNINYITSFTSRKNGDYDILLSNQDEIRASRNFSENFKPYFESLSLE